MSPTLTSTKRHFAAVVGVGSNLLESRNVQYISEASPVYIQKLKENKTGEENRVCQTARTGLN